MSTFNQPVACALIDASFAQEDIIWNPKSPFVSKWIYGRLPQAFTEDHPGEVRKFWLAYDAMKEEGRRTVDIELSRNARREKNHPRDKLYDEVIMALRLVSVDPPYLLLAE